MRGATVRRAPARTLTRCTRSQVTKFIEHISDLGLGLPYIMPAIEERLGSQWAFDLEMKVFVKDVDAHNAHRRGRVLPKGDVHTIRVVEPSEEIRLSLGKLVTAIFDTACRVGVLDMVKPYLHNIVVCAHVRVTGSPLVLVLVLGMPTTDETPVSCQACAVDPFPELRVHGYHLVAALCRTQPLVLKHYATGLVKAMMLGLDHRHAKVRIAALDAVDAAVTCEDAAKCRGAGTEAIVDLIGCASIWLLLMGVTPLSATRLPTFVLRVSQTPRRKCGSSGGFLWLRCSHQLLREAGG